MKNKYSSHNDLVKGVLEVCSKFGLETRTEFPLPFGKGSVDVTGNKNNKIIFHAEVKSFPSSVNKKKVKKQLNLYKKYFGKKPDYILISPDAKNCVSIQVLGSLERYSLEDYLSYRTNI